MTWPDWGFVALIGMLGAAIPEVLRVVAALKEGRAPKTGEYIASVILILLGAGVLFFFSTVTNGLQIAVTGAAFPQLFSGLVAAAKPPSGGAGITQTSRTVWQYIGWQL